MLRHELGDAAFWRAIAHYAGKHAHGSVETRDLARAIEEATGRNVDELLDRWIARAGHPELEGRWEWDEDRKLGTLRHRAEAADHAGGAAVQVLGRRPLRDRRARARRTRQRRGGDARLRVPPARAADAGDLRSGRRRAEVDPAGEERGAVAAAAGGRAAGDRSRRRRARAGPAPRSRRHRRAGGGAARRRSSGACAAAAARALGQTRREDARAALVAAVDDKHPRVRRAVAAALGEFLGDETAARALAGRAAPRRRQLLRRGRGGAGAGTDPRRRRRWRCCRRCSTARRTRT